MSCALECLDASVRRLEQGELSALELLDTLLGEEHAMRESRRIKSSMMTARLTRIKTLQGFDFSFQPSLDREHILALAQLDFISRGEVVHLLDPPGTGKSHLAIALGVEAVKTGRSVYFATLAEIIDSLTKAEREGKLAQRINYITRPGLLIIDEVGYLPIQKGGANLFFQLINARYYSFVVFQSIEACYIVQFVKQASGISVMAFSRRLLTSDFESSGKFRPSRSPPFFNFQ